MNALGSSQVRHDALRDTGERRLPSAPEAEIALLGSLLLNHTVLQRVEAIVDGPEDFSLPKHGTIYAALVAEIHHSGAVDLALLHQRLVDEGVLDDVGGPAYLLQLAEAVPSAVNAPQYAQVVAEKAVLRRHIDALAEGISDALDHPDDVAGVIARAADRQNAIRAPKGLAAARMNPAWMPVAAHELGDGDLTHDWVWNGYLAKGQITLLVGYMKAGKTTLLSALLALRARGGDLIGPVRTGATMYVTEESSKRWAKRRDTVGLGPESNFIVRPFKGKPTHEEWRAFVDHVAHQVEVCGFDLVVFDTLSYCLPVENENDASEMQRALVPLYAIAEKGAAVLLVHHARKGEGEQGTAARGSTALAAFVDILMELRRLEPANELDRRRVLKSLSRCEETPLDAVVELSVDGVSYTSAGTTAQANAELRRHHRRHPRPGGTSPDRRGDPRTLARPAKFSS